MDGLKTFKSSKYITFTLDHRMYTSELLHFGVIVVATEPYAKYVNMDRLMFLSPVVTFVENS